MFIESLKYFNTKDKLWLLIGSITYRVMQRVPTHVFEIRNFADTLKQGKFNVEEQGSELKVTKEAHSFLLRKKSSDLQVFRQIWINKEFRPVVEIVKRHQIQVETIFDAGANVGLSTIYLKRYFPQAQVVCVEPDKSNVTQLKHNLAANCLDQCTVLEGGVWSHRGWLDMDYSFRDGLEWSRALKPSTNGDGTIPVFSVEDIMKQNEWASLDLLKMDIEGAEDVIFSEKKHLSFLKKIKVFTIEIHDMYNTGSRVVEALSAYDFHICFSGELIIGINNAVCKAK